MGWGSGIILHKQPSDNQTRVWIGNQIASRLNWALPGACQTPPPAPGPSPPQCYLSDLSQQKPGGWVWEASWLGSGLPGYALGALAKAGRKQGAASPGGGVAAKKREDGASMEPLPGKVPALPWEVWAGGVLGVQSPVRTGQPSDWALIWVRPICSRQPGGV